MAETLEQKQIADVDAGPLTNERMLDEATRIIQGARKDEYGPALDNFTRIADIWSVILDKSVTPRQVAMCMVGMKLARLAYTPGHRDSWVDIAGYVGCVDKMERGE